MFSLGILATLLLSLLVIVPNVQAAGALSVTPSSVQQTIADNVVLSGNWISVTVTDTGNAAVKDISASPSGQISSWFTLVGNTKFTLNPGQSAIVGFYVRPPVGQSPGAYTGQVTYSGTDTSSGKAVAASVRVSITVPNRPAWNVQNQRICTGPWYSQSCNVVQTVSVGDTFNVKVDVINAGNVPVTNIVGVLTLPSGFAQVAGASLTQPLNNLNNIGNQGTITWSAKATQMTSGKYVTLSFTVTSNVGSQTRTVLISVSG